MMSFRNRVVACAIALTIGVFINAPAPSSGGIPGIPGVPVPKPPIPQPQTPKLPKLPALPIPDISQLLGGEDVISTSIKDAVTGIPFLNDYVPLDLKFLSPTERSADGSFPVPSGSYWLEARSYCLHAGKHGLVKGTGYLYAPLKGSKAPMIHDILVKSAEHLEIPQRNVQQLIWAILARARFNDLSPELQADAVQLLTPTEILLLNQSAIGVVPDDRLGALLAKVPDPLKPVIQAENSLRAMLTSNGTYDAMERVAVLPSLDQPSKTVEPVRWSYDPRGLFVSYEPHGYQWTTNFYDVPGAVLSTQDNLGRVTALQDRHGNSVSLTYAPGGGVGVSGDPGARFYQIRSVRFVWQELLNGKWGSHNETVSTNRWTMIGVPTGNGHVAPLANSQNAQQAYKDANVLRSQFTGLLQTIHGNSSALSDLMALAALRTTFSAIGDRDIGASGMIRELNFPFLAWESVFAHSVGGHVAADVDAGLDDPPSPGNNVATPQDPDAQRLAQSPNCHELPPGQGTPVQQRLAQGFSQGGYPGAAGNPQNIPYTVSRPVPGTTIVDFSVNLGPGGGPVSPCVPGYWKITGFVREVHYFDLQTNQDYYVYQAWTEIYQQGQLVAQGGSVPFGIPTRPGSIADAVANALDNTHYKI